MTSQLSALDGTDNFNYLMALQDICSRIDSDSDSRRNSVAANSIFFLHFSLFLWSGNLKSIFFKKNTIRLLNNKFNGLSPSGGHHSFLFDQGFQKITG